MNRNVIVAVVSLTLTLTFFIYCLYSAVTPYVLSEMIALLGSVVLLLIALSTMMLSVRQRRRLMSIETRLSDVKTNLVQYINKSDSLFSYSSMGICELDLDGQIINANMAFCDLFEFDHETLYSINFYQLIDGRYHAKLQEELTAIIEKNEKFIQAELQCYKRNNSAIWLKANISIIRNVDNEPILFLVQLQNITRQKNAEDRLKHMAYHDALTGLPNRNKLEQFLNHILASSIRNQRKFSLLFVDLDHFKNINDTIGHEAGDNLLQIIGERLKRLVRTSDIVARLGGDEFVLVITDVEKIESVAIVARKLLEVIRQPIVIKGKEIYITSSIGIGIYPDDAKTNSVLMKNADLALYRAKEQGRNNYQFYTHEMTYKAQSRLEMQNALSHALVKEEFTLEYQPIMNFETRCINRVEALLRWQNEQYGLISSNKIIDIAEESGLIVPVSEWVINQACSQLKKWHDIGFDNLSVSINCSSKQFKQSNLIDNLLSTVSKYKLKPSNIALEITESIMMEDSRNTMRMLYNLKDLGFKITIDDFGTGYWSLNHVRHLQIDQLKIDRSFVSQLPKDRVSKKITSAILAMAKELSIEAAGEGVENKAQYDFLKKEGCSEVQGYYITPPLNSQHMTNFLRHPIPDAEKITQEETIK